MFFHRDTFSPAHVRIVEQQEDVYRALDELEEITCELQDYVQALRVNLRSLFATQRDYGNSPR